MEHEGVEVEVIGVVSSLPEDNGFRTKFALEVEQMQLSGHELTAPGRLLLSWYETDVLIEPGQVWSLRTKLKRPRGLANPHSFDYERWLFQQRVRGTGYVIKSDENQLLDQRYFGYLFQRWRFSILKFIQDTVADARTRGLMSALIIGVRQEVEQQDWDTLRQTGTSHLFAISGLHVGIIGALLYWLGALVWRYLPGALLLIPAQRFGAVTALVGAFIYAGLAGFSIPTQRALIMLAVILGSKLLQLEARLETNLLWALLLVVMLDPSSVLSIGFWLSFVAVASIFAAFRWIPIERSHWGLGLIQTQWMVFLGLAPVLLILGFGISWLAPLVNLFLVPLFSFFLVPALFLSFLLAWIAPASGSWLLNQVGAGLELVLDLLAYVAQWGELIGQGLQLSNGMMASLILLVVLLWFPNQTPGRSLSALLVLPFLTITPKTPEPGAFWVTQLDVGQGLALVVRTSNHLLIYDTGPRFRGGFDTGRAILTPYLKAEGVTRIDQLILSNGDMDHRGGFKSLAGAFPITHVMSGEPQRIKAKKVDRCHQGQHWHWDGVDFEVLHPNDQAWKGNNASCVLRVSGPGGVLLITGDIESEAETELVKAYGANLKADLITVPHHGSASSSTPLFLAQVGEPLALISAGYHNRYGFPKPEVVERWRQKGGGLLASSSSGAITIRIHPKKGLSKPDTYRQSQLRYWQSSKTPEAEPKKD